MNSSFHSNTSRKDVFNMTAGLTFELGEDEAPELTAAELAFSKTASALLFNHDLVN